MQASDEYKFVLQSPDRKVIATNATNAGDATGAMHPYDRSKVFVAYGYGLTGSGVTIGVADVGYNLSGGAPGAHQEFSTTGKQSVYASSAPLRSDAHGTHVAGLAAADRNGVGMQGVAYNAKLLIGQSPSVATELKGVFDDYNTGGALVSNNSYGMTVKGTEASPWRPVLTSTSGGLEVTVSNALAYRDANNLTSAQMLAIVQDGTAAEWTAAVASIAAFQARGGVVVWSNSNYGRNDIDNGSKGLNDADLGAALPLAFPVLSGGWITAVNVTSLGLAIQANGQGAVDKATLKEGNLYLQSAQCGSAASFCLAMDGTSLWSGSNTGLTSYESQTGTSQAGPEIAGMLAILREAFPAASAGDLAARLLYTADNSFFINGTLSTKTVASYTNANGTISHTVSNVWGHGFADLQNALAPVGTPRSKTASGQTVDLASLAGTVQLARAFGDAGQSLAGATYLYNDMLDGVFVGSLRGTVASSADTSLFDTVNSQMLARDMATTTTPGGLSLSLAQTWGLAGTNHATPDMAFSIRQTVGDRGSVSAGFGFSPDSALGFATRHAGIRGASPSDAAMGIPYLGLGNRGQSWAATSSRFGKLNMTVAGFASTSATVGQSRPLLSTSESARQLQNGLGGGTSGIVADLVWDGLRFVRLNLSVGQVHENGSFLGSVANTSGLRQGADSRFVRVGFSMPLGGKFGLQGNYATAQTAVQGGQLGLLANLTNLRTEAMALALTGDDLFLPRSRLTLGVSQPLRVVGGTATLNLPQQLIVDAPGSYRYGYNAQGISFAPHGRQVDYTVELSQRLGSQMSWGIAGRLISQPGHRADAPLAGQALVTLKMAM